MSWKSRKRKVFFRYVDRLKKAPIYLIDQYIFIDEFVGYYRKKNMSTYNNSKHMQSEYERFLRDDKIKSSRDFDNYFSPYLTLDILFEKDQKKANALIKKMLIQIGKRWVKRLQDLFPDHDYTLIVFLHSEASEWYLDFYNGVVDIEKNDKSGYCQNIIYLNK